jgi:pimeloyl-ACP methyl ester carboxylesterase
VKSGYVFVFNLPYPLANVIGNVGDFWWYRYLNAVSTHPDPPKPLSGAHGMELLASSVGPSTRECGIVFDDSHPELAYSYSVRERASTGGSQEKITYYRHGLAFSPWEKSLETLWELNQLQEQDSSRRSSSGDALFDTGPEGSLKAPATIIWGKSDIALETSLALEGFKDFFASPSSQVIQIRRCGHWTPLEKQAVHIFEEVIVWTLGGENGTIREQLGDSYPMAVILSER